MKRLSHKNKVKLLLNNERNNLLKITEEIWPGEKWRWIEQKVRLTQGQISIKKKK